MMVIIVAKFLLSLIILCIIITSTYTSLAIAKGIDIIDSSSKSEDLYLEPTIKRHIGILPPHTCKELIRLGNLEGFTVEQESIDDYSDSKEKQPSQSIEVFERNDGITSPSIWKVLEPYIPRLTELVQLSIDDDIDRLYYPDEQPNRTPQLGWVFFRKYDPDTPRNSLKLHVDSNMHTLNIALNDNYNGGGLLYIRPSIDAKVDEEDGRPQILDQYTTYNWLNNVKRQNTTDVIFPSMNTGDVLIHNFTVWHGVAPLEAGTRYSFVLFYDMDNPAIQNDFYDNQDNGIIAVFYHELHDLNIDLVWVGETQPQEEENGYDSSKSSVAVIMMEEHMKPYKEYAVDTFEGHIFHAIISGTDVVLSKFVIMRHDDENNYENRYVIEKTKGDHSRHDNDEL